MSTKRRDFIKLSGLTGLGLISTGLAGCASITGASKSPSTKKQRFNMSGYAAPKIDRVRIGFIGLGMRGPGAVNRMSHIEGVDIKGLCDLRPAKVEAVQKSLAGSQHKPLSYSGSEEAWKQLCDRDDIDLIYICTPWHLHAPMAVYAMEAGKHVAVEVPAAVTIDECWQLVETSERTKQHCMMLENCCYDFFEMLTLNLARYGFFGEIVHCEGAYIHTFNFNPESKNKTWRKWENIKRNGNLYPMHGLGPVAQIMNLNYGDKMDFIVSVSGKDFMMGNTYKEAAEKDDFWKPFATEADKSHRGNMNTSIIRTNSGATIMLQHDITSPNVYSRIHKISGTNAAAMKYPLPPKINTGHEWLTDEEYKLLETEF